MQTLHKRSVSLMMILQWDSLQFLIEILGYPVETFGSAADSSGLA